MACNNCNNSNNGLTSCSCSDNCPTKTSDITSFDGNMLNINVPSGSDLNDVLALLEAYTLSSLNSGLTYTVSSPNAIGLAAGQYTFTQVYTAVNSTITSMSTNITALQNTVNTSRGMLAESAPLAFSAISYVLGSSGLVNGELQKPTEVYDDDSSYDAATGIYTVPETGRYDVSFYVRLSKNSGDGWYNAPTAVTAANEHTVITAGIHNATSSTDLVASSSTPVIRMLSAHMSGSINGVNLTQGNQLKLYITLLSQFNYVAVAGDVVRLSIRKSIR